MSCNWLREPREAAGFTQEALAAALRLNVKTIQRLERCGTDTPQQVRYADLATSLGVCPIQLAEHHARELDANRQAAHAQRTRNAADKLRRAKHFPTIDPRPIQSALAACRATGLGARIAVRAPDLPDEQAQAGRIARLLDDARFDAFATLIDIPLDETIARASTDDHLDHLEQFPRTIIRFCAAADEGLAPGRWHQHHGESKAWPYRAMIDHSSSPPLDGMCQVRAAPNTTEARLDDGRDSTRAVRSGNVSQLSVDARLYQLVCEIADTLGTVDQDRPAVGDAQAFVGFCETVNNELFRHNSRNTYVFGLWERSTCEAEEVKQGLLHLLGNLQLFDCGDPARTSTVLRVKREELETWYASHLRAIAERRQILDTTPARPTPSAPVTPKRKSKSMKPTSVRRTQDASTQIFISTGSGPTVQAAGAAQVHQHLSTPQDALLPLLNRLLAETGTAEPHYADLRKACRNAQGELEETKTLSEGTKTPLQRAIESLPTADKAFGVAVKVADLIAKIPGLGT